jgi:hypothetical protein
MAIAKNDNLANKTLRDRTITLRSISVPYEPNNAMISARTMTRVGHPDSFPDPPGMWIGGIASLYWLKRNFGGGLEDSRLLGACDPAKGGGAEHICGGVAEVRAVETSFVTATAAFAITAPVGSDTVP